jgi:hypothetical protein
MRRNRPSVDHMLTSMIVVFLEYGTSCLQRHDSRIIVPFILKTGAEKGAMNHESLVPTSDEECSALPESTGWPARVRWLGLRRPLGKLSRELFGLSIRSENFIEQVRNSPILGFEIAESIMQ